MDDPEEARRIRAKGGKLIEGGSRIVSPTGRHTLNMSRALGGASDSETHRDVELCGAAGIAPGAHCILGRSAEAWPALRLCGNYRAV